MRHILIIAGWYVLTGLLLVIPIGYKYELDKWKKREILKRSMLLPLNGDKWFESFWFGMLLSAIVSLTWPYLLWVGIKRAIFKK